MGQVANLAEHPRDKHLTTHNENASRNDCVKVLLVQTLEQLFCGVADSLRERELIAPAQDVAIDLHEILLRAQRRVCT